MARTVKHGFNKVFPRNKVDDQNIRLWQEEGSKLSCNNHYSESAHEKPRGFSNLSRNSRKSYNLLKTSKIFPEYSDLPSKHTSKTSASKKSKHKTPFGPKNSKRNSSLSKAFSAYTSRHSNYEEDDSSEKVPLIPKEKGHRSELSCCFKLGQFFKRLFTCTRPRMPQDLPVELTWKDVEGRGDRLVKPHNLHMAVLSRRGVVRLKRLSRAKGKCRKCTKPKEQPKNAAITYEIMNIRFSRNGFKRSVFKKLHLKHKPHTSELEP